MGDMPGRVLIIGGGPAGLTAAFRLSAAGYPVTVLDERKEVGGRLIDSQPGLSTTADTIPPVLLGCHHATMGLLTSLRTGKTAATTATLRSVPIEILPSDSEQSSSNAQPNLARPKRLPRPWIPGPLHGLAGLLLYRGLSFKDRWSMVNLIERTWEKDPPLPLDLDSRTGEEWLAECGQSEQARRELWTPLARFLLGEDLTVVSAGLFVAGLTRCFLSARHHSKARLPASGWQDLLLDPIRQALDGAAVTIRTDAAVGHLLVENQAVCGVQLKTGGRLESDWVISTVPYHRLTGLLPERVLTHYSYFQQLTHLQDAPALTLHLWLDDPVTTPRLLLLAGRTFHWVVIKTVPRQGRTRGLASLVATGDAALLSRSDREIKEAGLGIIKELLPGPNRSVTDHQIVRSSRAFLSLRPGTDGLRPLQQSPFANLFVAGDWTDTGLPATLESAVLSGERCAEAVMKHTLM